MHLNSLISVTDWLTRVGPYSHQVGDGGDSRATSHFARRS